MNGSLLDTSVLTASDPHGALGLPESAAISVVSLGELHAGVELARSDEVGARRRRRLAAVRATFRPLPVDTEVARRYGELLATAHRGGRTEKASDLLILATARATGRRLVTRDERQARLARAAGQEADLV